MSPLFLQLVVASLNKKENIQVRCIFAGYLSVLLRWSSHLSQILHVYAISAFKISSYYCIKVCFFIFLLIFMTFAGIAFCPSVNLEQQVILLILFFTCQLSCGRNALPDFIRTTEFTGFKMRIQGRILYSRFSF